MTKSMLQPITRIRRALVTCVLLLASLWTLMYWAGHQSPTISNVQLSTNNNNFSATQLPIRQNIDGAYRVQVSLNPRKHHTSTLQIIPDDELLSVTVNGAPVSLSSFSRSELRDYNKGIKLTLHNLDINENNLIELHLTNNSNPAGLSIRPVHKANITTLTGIAATLLLLVYALFRHIKLSSLQWVPLALGLFAVLIYLGQTDSHTRTFDVYEGGGHRDYIHYLITEHSLPPPGGGWEYHQPPLYYSIAALTKTVFAPEEMHGDFWGQLLALWFWCIFLVASLGTLNRSLGKSRWAVLIASVAVCIWPAGVIHSIRIGNDVALYAFYGLAFYYSIIWWKGRASTDFFWATIWASAALLTKSNALAIWGVIGILFLIESHRLFKKPEYSGARRKIITNFVILVACFVTTLAINFGDNVWQYLDGKSSDWLLSNVSDSINPGLRVANKPFNYLVFDLATFLKYPFISSWDDLYGRQYFWNFVWRSALTSEFTFQEKNLVTWAKINGLLLLLMLAGVCLYAVQQQLLLSSKEIRRALYKHLPWLLALVFPFLLLLAYRIKVPLSCNTDFRYIYPVLVPLLFFSALAWRSQPQLKCVRVMALGGPLIALSTWFWLVYI